MFFSRLYKCSVFVEPYSLVMSADDFPDSLLCPLRAKCQVSSRYTKLQLYLELLDLERINSGQRPQPHLLKCHCSVG